MRNPHFNVLLGQGSKPNTFLNQCLKRVEARMPRGMFGQPFTPANLKFSAGSEGFRLHFGIDVLGSGEQNGARVLGKALLDLSQETFDGHPPDYRPKPAEERPWMRVSLFGEEKSFILYRFNLIGMTADQNTSFMGFEAQAILENT